MESEVTCRGSVCTTPTTCKVNRGCLYKSSGDEAREMREQARVQQTEAFGIPNPPPELKMVMPADSQARKNIPLCTGVLDYFAGALAFVAKLSKQGNDKHNPGEPLHWSRGKSSDHADCILRHLADRGVIDPDTGMTHTVEVAWRALALLQEELEAAGLVAQPRGAR